MKQKKLPIMTQLILSFTLMVVIISVFFCFYTIHSEISLLNSSIDERISLLSSAIATDSRVVASMENNDLDASLPDYFDRLLDDNETTIDLIVIVDADSRRIYHPIPSFIGELFVGDDQHDILSGSLPYITEATGGTRQSQRRAFHAIRDETDAVIGFVMVAAYSKTIQSLQTSIWLKTLTITLISVLLALLFAYFIATHIKKSLLGNEPFQIAHLFLQKEAVLDTLTEGVVLVSPQGNFIYANEAARTFFTSASDSDEELRNFVNHTLKTLLNDKHAPKNQVVQIQDTNIEILLHRLPLYRKTDPVATGTVIVMQNKSEATQLAEELTGIQHVVEALRASTHEHKNNLHIILGLLQMNDTPRAIRYIQDISQSKQTFVHDIDRKIENKTIAALILGKSNRAKELSIALEIAPDSYLDEHNSFLSTNDLTIIIGNLIENSFDALTDTDKPAIFLAIHAKTDVLHLEVSDNGSGIDPEIFDTLFDSTTSTKGSHHGVGLNLIKGIVDKRDGSINIETQPHRGTRVTIVIRKKRMRYREDYYD